MSTKFRAHATLAAIVFVAVLAACSEIPSDVVVQAPSAASTPPSDNELINGYRQWTRVNPKPAVIDPGFAKMCAIPPKNVDFNSDPHRDHFITVYVNELGTKSMTQESTPRFPQGSVIVKEKLPSIDSTSPELLTVMVKREAGYNPENGDWDYMVFDGTGKEVQARGKLEKCQNCHSMAEHSDFVYRNYLPSEAWKKMK